MPKQRVSAKGRRRANSPRLALAGSNPGKGRESFVPALENKEETRKKTPLVSPAWLSPRGGSL